MFGVLVSHSATDSGGGRTRLITVDGRTGALRAPIEVPGQLTSPVPTRDGIVEALRDALLDREELLGDEILSVLETTKKSRAAS